MGFGRELRRASDGSLPPGARFAALRGAVERCRPLGYAETFAYLEARTGRAARDPAFLDPAIELLAEQRSRQLALAAEYAALRRLVQKPSGLRFPPLEDVTPTEPRRWLGDERAGAGVVLARAVSVRLPADLGDLPALQAALTATRRRHRRGWDGDARAYWDATADLRVLGQLFVLRHGALAVGTPWHFVAPPGPR